MTADRTPDPARPDAVQVPQAVALGWQDLDGNVTPYWRGEPIPAGSHVVPASDVAAALTSAELAGWERGKREERAAERAAVVAWLRAKDASLAAVYGPLGSFAHDVELAACLIERGDHRDPT